MAATIFAQATPPGRSGVAIIRVSGPAASAAVSAVGSSPLPPRLAVFRRLLDPSGGRVDDAVLIYFPGPRSFTGEDVLEIQCHGSTAVLRRLLDILGDVPDLRPAEPGEFTRRALENGRLDLTEVEGLGDLLAAETEAQRRQALALASGALSREAADWRDRLVRTLAHVEAMIDFSDDGVANTVTPALLEDVASVAREITDMLERSRGAERVRSGFTVALCGPPNAGKSTLLNAMAGREVALTSTRAGTTRDVLEVRLDLNGLPVTVLDTAGLREAEDEIEAMGVARALARLDEADMRVILVQPPDFVHAIEKQDGDIVVVAKADLGPEGPGLPVSGLTGDGLPRLLASVEAELRARVGQGVAPSTPRQVRALAATAEAASLASAWLGQPGDEEFAAAELRSALHHLDCLVGRVDVEDVLDVVFREFCLGK